MAEENLRGERREQRQRNLRKMRVSGRMTATVNAIRKRAAAAEEQPSGPEAGPRKAKARKPKP